MPAFEAMHEHRTAMRKRVYEEQGVSIVPMPAPGAAPAARMVVGAFADLRLARDGGGEAGAGRMRSASAA